MLMTRSLKLVLAVLIALIIFSLSSCNKGTANTNAPNAPVSSQSSTPKTQTELERQLEQRLRTICDRAQGSVGVALVHVETGQSVSVNGNTAFPLYSVFKLPLAIAVLKDVEANRLKVDQIVHVTPQDIVPGAPDNTALWREPVDRTIAQLIEVSIARSDNTSTDKLIQLIGGPARVTEQMRALGLNSLDIHSTISEFAKTLQNPNTGSAGDLVNLLSQLQQGKVLQPAQSQLLIGFMRRATTGLKRIRGDLPAGTVVADKTGSGVRDSATNVPNATNDVGLITLPNSRGTLAIAVLVSESKLADTAQEKLIAEIARAAYDAYTKKE